jgi:putative copper export protein
VLKLILFLHLLGAAVWVGGHLVLALTILPQALRLRDPAPVHAFEDRYERLGVPALVLQVLTGVWLAYRWLPDVGAWFGFGSTPATVIFVKLVLLALTLALALHARLRIVPRLSAQTLPVLAVHVVLVTAIGVVLVYAGLAFRTGGLF